MKLKSGSMGINDVLGTELKEHLTKVIESTPKMK